jgi:hypothetical protein
MGPSSIVEHIGLPDEKKTIIPASYSFLKLDFDGIIRKLLFLPHKKKIEN